jgi:thermostable 8-oxoguanine DNA glycosylase
VETIRYKRNAKTVLSDADREALSRIIDLFGQFVELETLGRYSTMSAQDAWMALVIQVCVMGSARHFGRIESDTAKRKQFEAAVSLEQVGHQSNSLSYLRDTLRDFSATRFPQKSAERLMTVLQSSTVFQEGHLILFQGLSHTDDGIQTRDELIKRCPIFRLKSASDFMIGVGLSHDVIALDTRVVGILQDYFGYNLNPAQVQSNRKVYFSLEEALREFCRGKGVSLALLDRLLFRFSDIGAIELAIKYPGFWRLQGHQNYKRPQEYQAAGEMEDGLRG